MYRVSEYHYKKVNEGGNTYSGMREYTPRIDKNYTYSMKESRTTTRKGGDYFSTNGYSTYNTASQYNGNSFSSKKCSCAECGYGTLDYCTCEKCLNEGKSKYSSSSLYENKKIRGRSVESGNLSENLDKKCICGDDPSNCTCGYYGTSMVNYNSSNVRRYGNSSDDCTCGRLVCTCGKRHVNSAVHAIKVSKYSTKKKCI